MNLPSLWLQSVDISPLLCRNKSNLQQERCGRQVHLLCNENGPRKVKNSYSRTVICYSINLHVRFVTFLLNLKMTSARPTPLTLMPMAAASSTNSNKLDSRKFILHILRSITILSTVAAVFLLCYIIRSEDAKILFLQLLNANGDGDDVAVEQSAGARSIIASIWCTCVVSCASNYFLVQEKKRIRSRGRVLNFADEERYLSDEGFVLASLSCASHAFMAFLLFGTFRINMYDGVEPGELSAFFFGLLGLIQTILFLVLAALIIRREKKTLSANGTTGLFESENRYAADTNCDGIVTSINAENKWRVSSPQDVPKDGGNKSIFGTDFMKMSDKVHDEGVVVMV